MAERWPILAGLWLWPLAAWAEGPATAPRSISGIDPVSTGSMVQMLLGLGLVVGLILLASWLLRRVGGLQGAGAGPVQILGGRSLGPRERVVLLQVGEEQLLVGVAPGRVQTLHVLGEPIAPSDPATPAPEFARRLAERMTGRTPS